MPEPVLEVAHKIVTGQAFTDEDARRVAGELLGAVGVTGAEGEERRQLPSPDSRGAKPHTDNEEGREAR